MPETDLADAYRNGATMEQLVAQTGLSFRQVRQRLHAAEVEIRPRARQAAAAPAGLVGHYLRGATIRATAKAYGLTYGQTRRMLLIEGVVLRPHGGAR